MDCFWENFLTGVMAMGVVAIVALALTVPVAMMEVRGCRKRWIAMYALAWFLALIAGISYLQCAYP